MRLAMRVGIIARTSPTLRVLAMTGGVADKGDLVKVAILVGYFQCQLSTIIIQFCATNLFLLEPSDLKKKEAVADGQNTS